MSTIGNRIRNKRLEEHLTVEQLAERIGKNRATVYRYESDDIDNMPVAVIGDLAEALHTSPAYLMGWDVAKGVSINEKNSSTGEPALEDEHAKELMELVQQLTPEQTVLAIAILKTMISQNQETQPSDPALASGKEKR